MTRIRSLSDSASATLRDLRGSQRAARTGGRKRVPLRLEIASGGARRPGLYRPAAASRRPGEVVIRVRATGLNFRDVLNALGMYPARSRRSAASAPAPCGGRCGIDDLRVGTAVVALAHGSFATFADHRRRSSWCRSRRPRLRRSRDDPVAFLTAHYALRASGRSGPGERVLIHAAAGGVGLAAVQLAQRAGAEVFATAGSPEKRAYLRSLGVAHVFDSRSLDFADECMSATGGRGVDSC